MTSCTHNEQTASLSDLFSLGIGFFLVFSFECSECFTSLIDVFVISFCKTCCFDNKLLWNFHLTHFRFCEVFGITTKDNISTTTSHICCDSNSTELTSLSDDFSFFFVIFSIENIVLDTLFLEQRTENLGLFDRNCTNKNRLTVFVSLHNILYESFKLALLCFEDSIREVDSLDRFICRNFYNIKLVNFLKFCFFGHSSTSHTRELFIHTEVILECDSSKSFAFTLNLNAFLSFNSLMQAFIVSSAIHKTACAFVNDDNFSVLDNIINILTHNAMSLDSLVYMMLIDDIFRVSEVFDSKIFLNFFDTERCKSSCFSLLINDIVYALLFVKLVIIFFVVDFNKLLAGELLSKLVSSLIHIC